VQFFAGGHIFSVFFAIWRGAILAIVLAIETVYQFGKMSNSSNE
jgi:hypothetical protein